MSETSAGEECETLISRTEHYAREEPLKAVSAAFAAGLFLTLLPVGAIFIALVRLALTLLRPALLVLGAVKLYEEIDRRQHR